MMPAKLQVKLFAEGSRPDAEIFIRVFHEWLKHHRLKEMMIDVANYAHVPKGPSVALIGHGSDYFIDDAEGRPGLLYSRKREAPAPEERLRDSFRRALHAAMLLEQEPTLAGKLRFRTDEVMFRINDRLAAPSTEATYAALSPELDAFCGKLFGEHKLALAGTPRDLFSVRITAGKQALGTLLDRLGGPPEG